MQQFNFPTTVYFGEDALEALATSLGNTEYKKALLVSDKILTDLGLVATVASAVGIETVVFDEVHPNPIEEDVEKGAAAFNENGCDCIIALGGGSPMDVAKVIKVAATHPGPLAQYDEAAGGDKLIVNEMPPLYAIPTTSGTGSEVGRSGIIVMRETKKKTIIFAPTLMPDIAVLSPQLTTSMPAHITAATGIDAFIHSLEAYLAPGFHPMADGIAIEGMRLCIGNLGACVTDGDNLDARGKMQVASMMGATAFQKGLGMIHSLAHPLSAHHQTHHGLANAILAPESIRFIEDADLSTEQSARIGAVLKLFRDAGMARDTLSETCLEWFRDLGITFGLRNHGILEGDLGPLATDAFEDPCHRCNMIPVTHDELLSVYQSAL